MNNIAIRPMYIPTASVELITPEIAEQIMQHNKHNPRKKINQHVVAAYAEDMKRGNFFLNGESIVIDANGDLKDGQHRLLAIIKAGVSIYMMVVRGVDPSITTWDYGRLRRVNQEVNCSIADESLAKLIVSNAYRNNVPIGTLRDYIQNHGKDIHFSVLQSCVGAHHPIGRKRDIYSLIYIMRRTGYAIEQDIDAFMRVVNTGFADAEYESTPAIVFRNMLINNGNDWCGLRRVLDHMQVMLRAFNDFTNGNARRSAYRNTGTDEIEELLTTVRRIDGIA